MSQRQSVYVVADKPCDGGKSPNAYVAKITTELRVFFPPNTVTRDEVLDLLENTYLDAHNKTLQFFEERDR